MAGETPLTVVGRLTEDPTLNFTPAGVGVANLNVAVNARVFNRERNEWVNKPATYWRCSAYSQGKLTLAENIANVLKKGDNVIVTGEVETEEWQRDGATVRGLKLRVHSVGKDLRFHSDAATQSAPGAWDPHASQQNSGQGGGWQPPAQGDGWGSAPGFGGR